MGFEITAKSTGKDSGEILVYGDICDEKWWEEDVTPSDFDKKLKDLGEIKDLTVRINSYGGSVFAGQAIVAMLDRKRAGGCKVTTVVDGIAASMASVIAQVGEPVVMADGAMMMVHKPSGAQWGNADDLRKYADMLDKAEDMLVSVYMRHYSGTENELRATLREEKWMTAEDALACGLCSVIESQVAVAAYANGYRFGSLSVPMSVLKGAEKKIKLAEEGVENMFDEATQKAIEAILDDGKNAMVGKIGEKLIVTEMLDEAKTGAAAGDFITIKQVKGITGEDVSSDSVLSAIQALVDAGIPPDDVPGGLEKLKAPAQDPYMAAKAAKYDQILTAAIDDALKNAVRAKGERYNEARERKMLEALTYEEVVVQSADWLEECKAKFHAGRRVSVPGAAASTEKTVNLDDFKI